MNKVDNLLVVTARNLRIIQDVPYCREANATPEQSLHDSLMDEITGLVVNEFDANDPSEAALCVSVMVMCLRGSRGFGNHYEGGLKPFYMNHTKVKHFKAFHKMYGDRILAWDPKDEYADETTKRIQKVLNDQYHTTITSYAMSKVVIDAQQAA